MQWEWWLFLAFLLAGHGLAAWLGVGSLLTLHPYRVLSAIPIEGTKSTQTNHAVWSHWPKASHMAKSQAPIWDVGSWHQGWWDGFRAEGLVPWPAKGCRIFHFTTKWKLEKLHVMFQWSVVDSLDPWKTSNDRRQKHAGSTSYSQGWPVSHIQEEGWDHKEEEIWIEKMIVRDVAARHHICSIFPHPAPTVYLVFVWRWSSCVCAREQLGKILNLREMIVETPEHCQELFEDINNG